MKDWQKLVPRRARGKNSVLLVLVEGSRCSQPVARFIGYKGWTTSVACPRSVALQAYHKRLARFLPMVVHSPKCFENLLDSWTKASVWSHFTFAHPDVGFKVILIECFQEV
jgi:hypothetical protein